MLLATLSVEGREFPARPLPGSAMGSASGIVVLVESEAVLHDAEAWMPGRVLVLTDKELPHRVIDALLAETRVTTFVAIVVLCDQDSDLGLLGGAQLGIPMVAITRPADREWVRRALRVTLAVHPAQAVAPSVRRARPGRRRVPEAASTAMPGTVRTVHG